LYSPRYITASPRSVGDIVHAALVLTKFEFRGVPGLSQVGTQDRIVPRQHRPQRLWPRVAVQIASDRTRLA
jgi:hypothetical protein